MQLKKQHAKALLRIEDRGKGRPNNRSMYPLHDDYSVMKPLREKGLIRTSWGSSTLREVTDEKYASITDKGKEVCRLLVEAMPSAQGDMIQIPDHVIESPQEPDPPIPMKWMEDKRQEFWELEKASGSNSDPYRETRWAFDVIMRIWRHENKKQTRLDSVGICPDCTEAHLECKCKPQD